MTQIKKSYSPKILISDLLNAGIHLGHNAVRWNPKMASYIYGEKNKIHIFNLRYTAYLMQNALSKIYEVAKNNGKILFVGTKIQAGDIVAQYAEKAGQYYIAHKWLGGLLTNWDTISKSIKKLNDIERTLETPKKLEFLTKKEILDLTRSRDKLLKIFRGIRKLNGKPNLIVIIDTNKEHLAVKEAVKLKVPIVAVVDTNSDPDAITYPIPGNDDAIRSIKFYCDKFTDAVLAGLEEALISSGVDLGERQSVLNENSDLGDVKKLEKKSTKFSNVTGKSITKEDSLAALKSVEENSSKGIEASKRKISDKKNVSEIAITTNAPSDNPGKKDSKK